MSAPLHPMDGPILVTGAAGYIGGHLVPELAARGYRVRALLRAPLGREPRWPGVEEVIADVSRPETLPAAMRGVHTAYYLIHSLLLGPRRFEMVEIENARHFREAAEAAGVRRIIYLGGLGDVRTTLSPHLRSRARVAEELARGPVPVTVLRAAIIIGSGSASYEIIQHLVRNLRIILIPIWGRTRCQPIAVRDVICVLIGALENPETVERSFDVGGPDVLTYEDMLRGLAEILGVRRLFLRMPSVFSSVRPYAYFAGLLTPVPAAITRSLMEGIRNDVVCQGDEILRLVPFRRLTFREAVIDAMSREEQDQIRSRWTDAYPPAHELALKLREAGTPRYSASYSLATEKDADRLFRAVCRIGGREGWFHGNWMWRARGMMDSLLMGVGAARGRRSRQSLRLHDVIDFWRVEEIEPPRRLLLRAEMRLPGRAWLAFDILPEAGKNRLRVTAHYDTHTFFGRIYWYIFLPFHHNIFINLIRQIERRS